MKFALVLKQNKILFFSHDCRTRVGNKAFIRDITFVISRNAGWWYMSTLLG